MKTITEYKKEIIISLFIVYLLGLSLGVILDMPLKYGLVGSILAYVLAVRLSKF